MAGIVSWCLQRIVSVILILVVLLNTLALTISAPPVAIAAAASAQKGNDQESFGPEGGFLGSVLSQDWFHAAVRFTFIWYAVWLHISVTVFPFRACYSIRDITSRLKRSTLLVPRSRSWRLSPKQTRSTADSMRSPSTSSSNSPASGMSTPLTEYDADSELEEDYVFHAILIPNYKEDLDGLRETLEVLSSHEGARSSYDIYLAMEESEPGSRAKALCLVEEFAKSFRFIDFTMHPKGIPGEAQGKSSNLKWAARVASERYQHSCNRENVIVTVMDSDSQLPSKYFSHLDQMHLSFPETAGTIVYVPPIVFDRNCQTVSRLVRVADIAWCCAGLSGLYATSRIRPPTSVYSVPLVLVDYVGGWDGGPEAIGEDLHMYLKCFLALRGNLTTRTLHASVSQSNVHGGKRGLRRHFSDSKARYKQGLRHMWGALDSGFFALEIWRMFSSSKSSQLSPPNLENYESYSNYDTSASGSTDVELDRPLLIKPNLLADTSPLVKGPNLATEKPHYVNFIVCIHRLYEAHCLPAHLFLFILSTTIYNILTPQSVRPAEYVWLSNVTGYLRAFGIISMVCVFICYENFHKVCMHNREIEMRNAGLYNAMVAGGSSFGHRSLKKNIWDYFFFTISGLLFGSLAALHAQVCHLWTLELVYGVSKKPTRLKTTHGNIV